MTSYRTLAFSVLAPIALFFFLPPTPSMAQDIGAWGMWGNWNDDQGRRHRSSTHSQHQSGSNTDREANAPNHGRVFPTHMTGGTRPVLEPEIPDIVEFPNTEEPGTILIDTNARKLYFILNQDSAYQYPISVGRAGYTWTGSEKISRIAQWPDWHPPKEMRQRDPGLPIKMTGGLKNPLGAVAIYLGDTLYRIHGTNDAKSIGRAASSGCIRMHNAHAVHLASLVTVGTTVKVVSTLEDLETVLISNPELSRSGG